MEAEKFFTPASLRLHNMAKKENDNTQITVEALTKAHLSAENAAMALKKSNVQQTNTGVAKGPSIASRSSVVVGGKEPVALSNESITDTPEQVVLIPWIAKERNIQFVTAVNNLCMQDLADDVLIFQNVNNKKPVKVKFYMQVTKIVDYPDAFAELKKHPSDDLLQKDGKYFVRVYLRGKNAWDVQFRDKMYKVKESYGSLLYTVQSVILSAKSREWDEEHSPKRTKKAKYT